MVSESLATVRESEDAFTYAQAHWLMAYGYLTQLRYPLAEKYIGSCVRAVEGNPVAFLPHLVRTEGAEDAEISEQSQDRMAFLASLISYRALLRVRVQDAKSGVPPEEAANVLDVRFCIFFSVEADRALISYPCSLTTPSGSFAYWKEAAMGS